MTRFKTQFDVEYSEPTDITDLPGIMRAGEDRVVGFTLTFTAPDGGTMVFRSSGDPYFMEFKLGKLTSGHALGQMVEAANRYTEAERKLDLMRERVHLLESLLRRINEFDTTLTENKYSDMLHTFECDGFAFEVDKDEAKLIDKLRSRT